MQEVARTDLDLVELQKKEGYRMSSLQDEVWSDMDLVELQKGE
jgi:hypothetical protein